MNQMDFINEVKNAIADGQVDTVEKLIGDDKEKLNCLLPMGSWLHVAVNHGQANIIQKLIDLGIDKMIIAPSHKGNPMVNAARAGRMDIVQLLLNSGFELETRWVSSNPLQEAIANGRFDVFKLLLEKEQSLLQTEQEKQELYKNCKEYAEIFGQNTIILAIDKGLKEEVFNESFDFSILKDKIKLAINKVLNCNEILSNASDIYSIALSTNDTLSSIGIIANTEKSLINKESDVIYYYKYNPEEWSIWINGTEFNDIILFIKRYDDQLSRELVEHFFKECITALYEIKKESVFLNIFKKDIYLDFYVRDYFSDEDIIENVKLLNSKKYVEEFMNNIEQIL